MDKKTIYSGIKSHEARKTYEANRAILAIKDGDYDIASLAVSEANAHKGAIKELEFLLEVMEMM